MGQLALQPYLYKRDDEIHGIFLYQIFKREFQIFENTGYCTFKKNCRFQPESTAMCTVPK